MNTLARYDSRRSYRWNYDHAPDPLRVEVPPFPGSWSFLGIPVDSPLGVPAGPLLNGKWCLYYAGLGFDILTYKTVRSRAHPCYEMPNLLPVACQELVNSGETVQVASDMRGSWAVSFGMPSAAPDDWRRDVAETRAALPPGKVLAVSVVGTEQPGWTLDELADDYARCAAWAVESGADVIEANFSCPNVSTCDGQLYQNCDSAKVVAGRIRQRVGERPLVIKIGHLADDLTAQKLIAAVGDFVDGVAMTNSIAAKVADGERSYFDGAPRGICGRAILGESLSQVARFRRLAAVRSKPISIVGVGGVATAADVKAYLGAGAEAVQLATAAMIDPGVALQIRADSAAAAQLLQVPGS